MPKSLYRIIAVLLAQCTAGAPVYSSPSITAVHVKNPLFTSQTLAPTSLSFRPPGVTGIASKITKDIASYSGAPELIYDLIWRIYLFQTFVKHPLPRITRLERKLFNHLSTNSPPIPIDLPTLMGVSSVLDLARPLQSIWNRWETAIITAEPALSPSQAHILQARQLLANAGYRIWRSLHKNAQDRDYVKRIVTGEHLHPHEGKAVGKINSLLTRSSFYKYEEALTTFQKPLKILSDQEEKVLGYLLLGFSLKDISEALQIAIGTASSHRRIIELHLRINQRRRRDPNPGENPALSFDRPSSSLSA